MLISSAYIINFEIQNTIEDMKNLSKIYVKSKRNVIARRPQADVQSPKVSGIPQEIATPVCALARNDKNV